MNEKLLDLLMHLFAIIANLHKKELLNITRVFVAIYLKKLYQKKTINLYLSLFDKYYSIYSSSYDNSSVEDHIDFSKKKIIEISNDINKELPLKMRVLIQLNLMIFLQSFESSIIQDDFTDLHSISNTLKNIAENLNLDDTVFYDLYSFIFDSLHNISDNDAMLIVTSIPIQDSSFRFKQLENFSGNLYFYNIKIANIFLVKYEGEEILEINNKILFSKHVYVFEPGETITSNSNESIYYNDIIKEFNTNKFPIITYEARKIFYSFNENKVGVNKVSLEGESGQMIGILGRSGTGKTTLLNLLNGSIKPQKGEILINGNIFNSDSSRLIGYVPQDDLLIEELTVFQNLYFSARLCNSNLSKDEINEKVLELLIEMELLEVKDNKVGTPLKKTISGGQRKRLNLALEIIREPYIIFIDEPTSGLSSYDSVNIMRLIHKLAINGKLIFVNIHQPNSIIYKLFDKVLIMDHGGVPVFFGPPLDISSYFNKISGKFGLLDFENDKFDAPNPEFIFKIIEEKKVNDFGEYTSERKLTPENWLNLFEKEQSKKKKLKKDNSVTQFPKNPYKMHNIWNQFQIFSKRNFLKKIADKQFLSISLTISPILAFILSLFLKYSPISNVNYSNYNFNENPNINAYIFLCIIVALFVGMITSAEELFSDRKLREREKFINLSKFGYINSIIFFIFCLSAIQTFLFIIIGNYILEIHGMLFKYWFLLFSVSCLGNIISLNISAWLNSISAIYITIPLIIIPQILLSGMFIKFDKLNHKLTSQDKVPIIADFTVTRWAYEALMVTQFRDNKFQKRLFNIEQEESNLFYDYNYLIPELNTILFEIENTNPNNSEKSTNNKTLIEKEIVELNNKYKFSALELEKSNSNADYSGLVQSHLKKSRKIIKYKLDSVIKHKNDILRQYTKFDNGDEYIELQKKYFNKNIAAVVKNSNDLSKIRIHNNNIIRNFEPIYYMPESNYARAHLFSANKKVRDFYVNTYYFNIFIIWLFNFLMWILLYCYLKYMSKTKK